MLSIKKILSPVDFPVASLRVLHQAAVLAHHFNSEIVLLHVLTEQSHAAGVPEDGRLLADWDLLAAIIQQAQKQQDTSLGPELEEITIHRNVIEGDAATAIVRTAEEKKADLIMMPSHGFTFDQFLLGSVSAGVIHESACPVWTCAHVDGSPVPKLAIRNILCAVEFGARCDLAVSWAVRMSEEFGAHLTLANVTSGVETWGPGGNIVDQSWKEKLISNATEQMAELQRKMSLKADIFIGSGDVPKVLRQAVEQTKADLLVTECYPYGVHLRTRGYGIMSAVTVPVLSV